MGAAVGAAGVVEEAVLLGAPVSIRGERWSMVRTPPRPAPHGACALAAPTRALSIGDSLGLS